VISVLTTAAISSYLTKQLDSKVAASQGRTIMALTKGDGSQPPPAPHGQDAGTVTAYLSSSGATGNVITADGVLATLSDPAVAALDEVPADDGNRTVDLPALGQYRAHASQIGPVTVVE